MVLCIKEPFPPRGHVLLFKSGIALNSAVLAAAMASSNVTDSNPAHTSAIQAAPTNSHDASNGNESSLNGNMNNTAGLHLHDMERWQQVPASGQVLLSSGQTCVGATHWSAILDDPLQFGLVECRNASRKRAAVDRLVSRYFNSTSPALFIIHRPTFNKQCRHFWLDPEGAPLIFIGLLYAFTTMATLSIIASGEAHPDTRGAPDEMLRAYKENCLSTQWCRCRTGTSHRKIRVRLRQTSLHSKKSHDDASGIISNGWISCPIFTLAFGMVQAIESDTLTPRHSLDDDFDEGCTELPPSRSESEITPMSYALWKSRVSDEAGKIIVVANTLQLPPFSEILRLDLSLREAYEKVPLQLRLDKTEITVTDLSSTILKRFSMSVLFEKSQRMLHRKILMKTKEHPEYRESKEAGLDASMTLLSFQGLIHQAASSGGPFALDRWLLSSLSIYSFLLAAMIIYMNAMNDIEDPHGTDHAEIQAGVAALDISRKNWVTALGLTPEARKDSLGLTSIVNKIHKALEGRLVP
ncbi:hypothetical protein DL98DRAFT_569426 [Cadophora sp. DSE1049]|nr:hypothetical protein DL98DRAFT_569426 [Cadophora sp. DSE1049]